MNVAKRQGFCTQLAVIMFLRLKGRYGEGGIAAWVDAVLDGIL